MICRQIDSEKRRTEKQLYKSCLNRSIHSKIMKTHTKVLRYHSSPNHHLPVIADNGRSGNLKPAQNIWNWAHYLMRACWCQERLTSPLVQSKRAQQRNGAGHFSNRVSGPLIRETRRKREESEKNGLWEIVWWREVSLQVRVVEGKSRDTAKWLTWPPLTQHDALIRFSEI